MYSKLLGLSVVTALMATAAFAEPQVQPGDSLENLSKVKVSTTVNGQAASLQELVASGQIRIVGTPQNAPTTMQSGSEAEMQAQPNDGAAPPAMDIVRPVNQQATLDADQTDAVTAAPEQPMTETIEN